jgi:hypothetical protein
MKKLLLLSLMISATVNSFAQELGPLWEIWKTEHGVDIEEYQDYGNTEYYISWSSSAGDPWLHDIFKTRISFDSNGSIIVNEATTTFHENLEEDCIMLSTLFLMVMNLVKH